MDKIGEYWVPLRKRVMVYDTDFAGVVYFASYMRWIEDAVTEYMRELGLSLSSLREKGVLFAVKSLEIEYLTPGKYDDLVDLGVRLEETTRRRVTFSFSFLRSGETLAEGRITYACINSDFQPSDIPEWLLQKAEEMKG